MKRFVFLMIPALICGIILASCSSRAELENSDDEMEGIYSGTYSMTSLSPCTPSFSGAINLELKNGKYACKGVLHSQAYFSGTYSINDDAIVFETEVWKTNYIGENGIGIAFDFDIYIIPSGKHSYTFDGKHLVLTKLIDGYAIYEHRFVKKNK